MLKLNNWTVAYASTTILHQIHHSFEAGAIHGILGQNGAGKSTLFNSLYGMITPTEGNCLFQGQELAHDQIAYLQTHNHFYPFMKGREYLELIAQKESGFDPAHWNQLFQLPLHQFISQYSTGMKKKLAFLGIIAQNKPIIILDEPFNGVDIESNEKIIQVLEHWRKQGRILLLSSHILSTLTQSCTYINHLHQGAFSQTYATNQYADLEQIVQGWARNNVQNVLAKDSSNFSLL
ncbi:MAG: ATP-binding cassette domain-containing protein [Aureispira sp.]